MGRRRIIGKGKNAFSVSWCQREEKRGMDPRVGPSEASWDAKDGEGGREE